MTTHLPNPMVDAGIRRVADPARRRRSELRVEMDSLLNGNKKQGLTEDQLTDFESMKNEYDALEDKVGTGIYAPQQYSFEPGPDPAVPHRFVDGAGRPIECRAAGQNFNQQHHVDDYAFGETITGILKGQPLNQQSGSTDSAGGFLLTEELSSRFVDLARANSVCLAAGTPTVQMDSRDLRIAKLTTDATSYWRAEAAAVTSSDMVFGAVTLEAKTLAALVPVSVELLEDASNIAQLVQQSLVRAMGQKIDAAILEGSGSGAEPTGLLNASGLGSVTSVGTPSDYSDLTTAAKTILTANYSGDVSDLAWVAHPRDRATFNGLADSTGQPLVAPQWAGELRQFTTTELPTTDGASSNESSMLVGDFREVVLGMRTRGIQVRIASDGTATDGSAATVNATDQLLKWIVCYVRCDVGVLRPDFFVKMTGVTA